VTRRERDRLRAIAMGMAVVFPPAWLAFGAFRWSFGFWPWAPAWNEPLEPELPKARIR
jgi:hypothetical protein